MTDTNIQTQATPAAEPSATATTPPATTTTPLPPATTTTPPPATTTTEGDHDAAATPPTEQQQPQDPRIVALHAMFPDYDELILHSVLVSTNGNQDRAIEVLLGMSDPEYKGDATPPATEPAEQNQEDLDLQLARQLMQEEEAQHQAAWQAQQQQDPRRREHQQQQQQQQYQGQGQGQGGDVMAEVQQQLGRIAETGKKTFGTFFSKVKAKLAEMDQPRSPQSGGTQPTWGSPSQGSEYDPAAYERRTQPQAHQQVPYATRPNPASQPQQGQQPQAAYYDPNGRESPDITLQGYDTAVPVTAAAVKAASTNTTPPLLGDTPRAASTAAATSGLTSPPIDGGKLGLLPKRPVSLMRADQPGEIQSQVSQDSEDDALEYAESPFEEPKPRK